MATLDQRLKLGRLRRTALLALTKRHDVDLDQPYSGAEDLNEMLEGGEPIYRFAIVTESNDSEDGGSFTYVYTSETLADAFAKALDNIEDDLWSETPIEIVDLDGGFVDDGVEYGRPKFKYTWRPRWVETPWTKVVGYN